MSNKELAVQLYSAYLNAVAQMLSNPSIQNPSLLPFEKLPDKIEWLTKELQKIEEKSI